MLDAPKKDQKKKNADWKHVLELNFAKGLHYEVNKITAL
jgi:hypothetical protein